MEFTPIETQEQFDAMVKDRVDRAKKSTAKEYEAQLKDMAKLTETITGKETEIGTLKQKIADLEAEKKTSGESYESMQKELATVKMGALKQRIAMEYGLPLEMADRLNGDDEESIRNDANVVKAFIGAKRVAPSFNNEAMTNPKDDGYRTMASMFGKEK